MTVTLTVASACTTATVTFLAATVITQTPTIPVTVTTFPLRALRQQTGEKRDVREDRAEIRALNVCRIAEVTQCVLTHALIVSYTELTQWNANVKILADEILLDKGL
jgi:hypothetical protein